MPKKRYVVILPVLYSCFTRWGNTHSVPLQTCQLDLEQGSLPYLHARIPSPQSLRHGSQITAPRQSEVAALPLAAGPVRFCPALLHFFLPSHFIAGEGIMKRGYYSSMKTNNSVS